MDEMTITKRTNGRRKRGKDEGMCWDTLDGHTEDSLER